MTESTPSMSRSMSNTFVVTKFIFRADHLMASIVTMKYCLLPFYMHNKCEWTCKANTKCAIGNLIMSEKRRETMREVGTCLTFVYKLYLLCIRGSYGDIRDITRRACRKGEILRIRESLHFQRVFLLNQTL